MARPRVYARFGLPGHNGLDIAYAYGWIVRSVADGVVERLSWDPGGYGYWSQVRHAGFFTRYAHGIRGTAMVEPGEQIQAGQPLFQGDSTGFSTGDHLHFEIRTSDRSLTFGDRWYLSDGGHYVLDPTLFLPAPFGEGREIGAADVTDDILRLERALAVAQAIVKDKTARFNNGGHFFRKLLQALPEVRGQPISEPLEDGTRPSWETVYDRIFNKGEVVK